MKRYGLIGYPLGHSFSKAYFTEKFTRLKLEAEYINFETPTVDAVRQWVVQQQLVGFNVTIPHKEAILAILDEVDGTASDIGAVNTVVADWQGERLRLIGYNTDVVGFAKTIEALTIGGHEALVLGTGGSAKAVIHVLQAKGMLVKTVSRSETKGQITYPNSDQAVAKAALIVNCTGLGTFPNISALPAISYQLLRPDQVLIDLAYNPPITAFLQKGQEAGCATINGMPMLIGQAEAAWEIWQAKA